MNVFIRERRPKSAFSIAHLYNVGSQMSKNDDLEVGCLENDNGEPPFLLHFLMEEVQMYIIGTYEQNHMFSQ